MKSTRLHTILLMGAALLAAPCARSETATSKVAFSDPSKPGTLRIRVWHGEIAVHGADVKEITVNSDSVPEVPTPRKDGLRVLSSSAGFAVSEKDNVATLDYGPDGWTGGSADFDITVPRSTSVVVQNTAHGGLVCTGISGDIDVRSMSGDVSLRNISGGALVETMRGDIDVSVAALAPTKPLSFTTLRGEITIHVPAEAKANVRFRTHRGVILTNFDDKALVTKTEVAVKPVSPDAPPVPPKGVSEAPKTPASPDARPEAPNSKADSRTESADSKPADSDGDWHAEVSDSIREATTEAAIAAREAAQAVQEGMSQLRIELSDELPPMTGGRVVAGTLNGGGVEIQAATLKGDITLKKIE
jgi:hypothetical protein